MTIDDFHNGKLPMPKLFRVVNVELVVLRFSYANGVYEYDTVVTRKVRRVKSKNGWVWQLAIEHKDQKKWDGHLVSDKESLDDVNYGYRLMQ